MSIQVGMDNKEHTCKRCGYTTANKSDLAKHLRRKTICPARLEDIPSTTLLEELYPAVETTTTFVCVHCGEGFGSKSSKFRHMRICTQNTARHVVHSEDSISHLQEVNQQLAQKVEQLERKLLQMETTQSTTVNNVTNNINNTVNNIQINGLGREDISYLLEHRGFKPFMIKAIRSKGLGICDLLLKTHFNPNHPENHNLKKMNKKDEFIHVYDGRQWMARYAREVAEDVVENLRNVFANFVEQELYDDTGQLQKQWVENFMQGIGSVLGWDLSTGRYDFSSRSIPEDKKEEAKKHFYNFILENIYLKSKELWGT